VRVDVAFTPAEARGAPTGLVIDVIRATSTICQALASGYSEVFCTAEIEDARALRADLGAGVLGGERKAVRIDGFDLGNSPREYVRPLADTLILTTTNGTRAIVTTATHCDRVFVASLLNLGAIVERADEVGEDVTIVCAGIQGALAVDDAYVAGRIVEALDCEPTDAAEVAARLAASWQGAEDAFRSSRSGRNLLENAPDLEEDLDFCARESVLDVVPALAGMEGAAARITV